MTKLKHISFVIACLFACTVFAGGGNIKGVKYFRFWWTGTKSTPEMYVGMPTTESNIAGYGSQSWGMQIGDIRLIRDGEEIAWPAGTTAGYCSRYDNHAMPGWTNYISNASAIIDFDLAPSSKVYEGRNNPNWILITLPSPVSFDQYVIYSGNDVRGRDPKTWHIDVSADGGNWYTIDDVKGFSGTDSRQTVYYTSEKGLELDLASVPGAATIDNGKVSFKKAKGAISARYLRWTVLAMWNDSTFLQLAEFAPTLSGNRLPWNPNGSATCDYTPYQADTGACYLYDGQTAQGSARCWTITFDPAKDPPVVNIDLGAETMFDGYDICSGDPQSNNFRMPCKWTLEAKIPGTEEWALIADVDFSTAESCEFGYAGLGYRIWHSDYSQKFPWSVASEDKRLQCCQVIPSDIISATANSTVVLEGVRGGFAAGSSIAGNIELADSTVIDVANLNMSGASIDGAGTIVYPDSNAFSFPSGVTYGPDVAAAFGNKKMNLVGGLQEKAKLKYVRFKLVRQLTGGTMFQFGEFELWKNGAKVAWPEGTAVVTYSHGHPDPADAWLYKPEVPAFNYYGSTYQSLIDGNITSCAGDQVDFAPDDSTLYASPHDFTIVLGDEIDFDSYKFYAGDLPSQRLPVTWEVQVSYDGATFYTIAGETDWTYPNGVQYKGGPASYSGTVDWSCITGSPMFNRIADDQTLECVSNGALTLDNTCETIGALHGKGEITFSGYEPSLVVLGADSSAVFSGTITGNGTLIVDGGTVTLHRADLKQLSKIVVRNNGLLKGSAYFRDSLQITEESGGRCTMYKEGGSVLILK